MIKGKFCFWVYLVLNLINDLNEYIEDIIIRFLGDIN